MLNTLREAIIQIEKHRKTIEVHSPTADPANEIADQFATKNVSVNHAPLPSEAEEGFINIRDADGGFLGSLGLKAFDAMLSPEIQPPWVLADSDTEYAEILDFLDNTVFSSYSRRQMLATAREIEERACRIGAGRLYVGFQDLAALQAQTDVYKRLADREELSIHLYVRADWEVDVSERLSVHTESADEIGAFWLVIYDGGGSDINKCGLLAEERQPGQYYGFWTYVPEIVDDLISYLEAQYGFS